VNDPVVVLTGKDRGKTGTIAKVLRKTGRIMIEGVNKQIRHIKGREGKPGERVEIYASIHASNVAIVDAKTGKPSRVGYKIEGNTKTRITKKSGEPIIAGKKTGEKTVKKAEKKTSAEKTPAKSAKKTDVVES